MSGVRLAFILSGKTCSCNQSCRETWNATLEVGKEKNSLASQPLSRFGLQSRTDLESGDDTLQDSQTLANRVGGIKHGFLRLLQVLVVGRRQTLERRQEPRELSERSA